jgi:hypothetical protein
MGRHSISTGPTREADRAGVLTAPTPAPAVQAYATEGPTTERLLAEGRSGLPHRRHHRSLWIATVVFWLIGLAAGFVATLVVGARLGCEAGAKGLACTDSGSALGVFLILAVIVVVGVCTVFAFEARDHFSRWARYLGVGLVLLVLVVVAARMLSSTL